MQSNVFSIENIENLTFFTISYNYFVQKHVASLMVIL